VAVTLSDVARKSGVSVGTVSRVLNGKMVSPIPADTIARIRRAAEDLHYRPNPLARALVTGKSQTLGLFSRELTDPHFLQMLEAVESKARELGYHLIVSSSLEGVSRKGRVDGTIVLGEPHCFAEESIPGRQPAIYVFHSEAIEQDMVAWSDEEGMCLATTHLLEQGHKHVIALFCYGEEKATVSYPKVQGFRRALANSNATVRECWEAPCPNQYSQSQQYENGYRNIRRLLAEGVYFTGIVARNDFIALGALCALREAGVNVPQDVSVVGYTDSIQAACADPPLTSVRTPIAPAGEIAVEQLVRRLDGLRYDFSGVLLPTSLSVRQSTAPAPQRTAL
jgi:LacI family transcriptional regulator